MPSSVNSWGNPFQDCLPCAMASSVVIDFSEYPKAASQDSMGYGVPATDQSEPVESSPSGEWVRDVHGQISREVAGQMWQAGTQSARRFIDMYGQLDYLRPYFDVEPRQVCLRLVRSFVPSVSLGAPQDAPDELYGPTVINFSLVAILLFGMKTSGHIVEEGTLIGTALAVCLGYWLIMSTLVFFGAYLLNMALSFLQVLSLMGYALAGHCLVLLLTTILDHMGSPGPFYLLWIIFGGLTSLKMVGVIVSRSWSRRQGLALSAVVATVHLGYLLYLRFAYHQIYEALAEAVAP